MAVLFDARTERFASISAAVSSWTHTATIANVAGAAIGFVRGTNTTDTITNVSYGGVSLVRINRAVDATTEPGAAEWWVTTSVPPSGQQAVHYSSAVTASNIAVTVLTFTGHGALYALGSQTKEVDNTTSHSVSITTGYVVGYGLGAIYWGGPEPISLSYGVDELTHAGRIDMGPFGAHFFRRTNPTTAGTGPLLALGTQQPTSDDLAFAAIFVTDGCITTTKGQPLLQGLVPVVAGYVFPGVGAISAAGQIPAKQTELIQTIGLGSVAAAGQIPSKYTELVQGVGLGSVATGGHSPQCLPENAIGCGAGLGIIEGRQPTLNLERIIAPGAGSAILGGRFPTVTGDSGTPVVEATVLPATALLTLGGQESTLAVEYDKPRGHAKRRSRYYGPEYVEVSADAQPVISLTKPQPVITEVVADFRPDEVLKLDTTGTEYRISEIESRRALIAKRRREEEELMAILMRAA